MRGNELRERRRAAGLTQVELADRAGVPQPNISAYEHERRAPSAEVVDRLERALRPTVGELLERHRDRIREVVDAHHAANPRVFGSVARGDATAASDLDVVVDFSHDASLLDEVGLRLDLQELLQIDVDVVGSDSLRGGVRERVLSEAMPL